MTPPIDFHALHAIIGEHLADHPSHIGESHTASAIQIAVGDAHRPLYLEARGRPHLDDSTKPIDLFTPFDIASLTKPLVGATLAWKAIDEELIDWHTPLVDIFPPLRAHCDHRAQTMTLRHLLDHSAGFRDWHPFFEHHPIDPDPNQASQTRRALLRDISKLPLEYAPGTSHTYSDLGFIVLAHLLEHLFQAPLPLLADRHIFGPLGLRRTCFIDRSVGDPPLEHAVATERCPHRKRLIQGAVHDTNTHVIGGVSTHAGVFSTASDLLRFATHLLRIDLGIECDPIIEQQTLHEAWHPDDSSTRGSHCGGWDRPSGEASSAGRGFARSTTVGHLGFTGTSLWIERSQRIIAVLLTNRVYPSRDNDRIKRLRIAVQETILSPSS